MSNYCRYFFLRHNLSLFLLFYSYQEKQYEVFMKKILYLDMDNVMGMSRDTFYRYQQATEQGGIESLPNQNLRRVDRRGH